jgi:hypothetical protein
MSRTCRKTSIAWLDRLRRIEADAVASDNRMMAQWAHDRLRRVKDENHRAQSVVMSDGAHQNVSQDMRSEARCRRFTKHWRSKLARRFGERETEALLRESLDGSTRAVFHRCGHRV